eukprot:m51a1_g12430 hypothetical protein (312) ;mRNA; r:815864-818309
MQARRLVGHSASVLHVCAGRGPRQGTSVTSSDDGTARLWDLRQPRAVRCFVASRSDPVNSACFWQHGVVASVGRSLAVFDTRRPEVVMRSSDCSALSPSAEEVVAVGSDGRCVAAADDSGSAVVVDVSTEGGRVLHTLSGAHTNICTSVKVLPGGKEAITAGMDSSVALWDLEHSKLLKRETFQSSGIANPPFAHCVAVSQSGSSVAVALGSGCVSLMAPSLQQRFLFSYIHESIVASVDFVGEDRIVTGGNDAAVCVWDCKASSFKRRPQDKLLLSKTAQGAKVNWVSAAGADIYVADETSSPTVLTVAE